MPTSSLFSGVSTLCPTSQLTLLRLGRSRTRVCHILWECGCLQSCLLGMTSGISVATRSVFLLCILGLGRLVSNSTSSVVGRLSEGIRVRAPPRFPSLCCRGQEMPMTSCLFLLSLRVGQCNLFWRRIVLFRLVVSGTLDWGSHLAGR